MPSGSAPCRAARSDSASLGSNTWKMENLGPPAGSLIPTGITTTWPIHSGWSPRPLAAWMAPGDDPYAWAIEDRLSPSRILWMRYVGPAPMGVSSSGPGVDVNGPTGVSVAAGVGVALGAGVGEGAGVPLGTRVGPIGGATAGACSPAAAGAGGLEPLRNHPAAAIAPRRRSASKAQSPQRRRKRVPGLPQSRSAPARSSGGNAPDHDGEYSGHSLWRAPRQKRD